jgi:hypothetical protein
MNIYINKNVLSKLFALLCFVGSLAIFFDSFVISKQGLEKSRAAILDVYSKVSIGANKKYIENVFNLGSYGFLTLHKDSQEWIISTPVELGASNWIMIIIFCKDIVSNIRIRTMDDASARPNDAPIDKSNSNACEEN